MSSPVNDLIQTIAAERQSDQGRLTARAESFALALGLRRRFRWRSFRYETDAELRARATESLIAGTPRA